MIDSTIVEKRAETLPFGSLLLLSAAVLLTVTAESMPAGLLPEMSRDLHVDAPAVGLLISIWALTVIVTSVPLSRLVGRVDRRLVVASSLAVFALANMASALAPDFGLLMVTRVIAAVAHGVFWAIVIVYASALLPARHLARGLAIVTAGGAAATLVGLPAATALAQTIGWRWAFALVGALALSASFVMLRMLPAHRLVVAPSPRGDTRRIDPTLPTLALIGVAAALLATAQFAAFTYVRPYLEQAVGIDASWSSVLLLAYGAAGMGGIVLAGALGDRFPRSAASIVLALFAVAFTALTLGAGSVPIVFAALLAWGVAFGASFPLLQTVLMRTASERLRTVASAGLIVMFNIGIAAGPWLGGAIGGAEVPVRATALAAAVMLVAAGFQTAAAVRAGRALVPAERRAS